MASVDPRRTSPFCTPVCEERCCRCARWPTYQNRFGVYVCDQGDDDTYADKVISYNPLVYYQMNEAAGAVAVNYGTLGTAANGAYTGVTLNNAVGPDGVNNAPYFDGANDYLNILTAALIAAAPTTVGSVMIWVRKEVPPGWVVLELGRMIRMRFGNDAQMYSLYEQNADIRYIYQSGASAPSVLDAQAAGDTSWMCLAMTFDDVVTNDMKAFKDGAQVGLTQNPIAAPVGALTVAIIGAYDTIPANVWHGWLAHCAVWDRVLTPAEIAILADPAP